MNPTENVEARNWVVEEEARQQRQGRRHYWWLFGLILLAVVGAVSGVWPILKGWITGPVIGAG